MRHQWVWVGIAGLLLHLATPGSDSATPEVFGCRGAWGTEATGYRALKTPAPEAGSTWAVLDRDGANRKVEPYLSSLAGGEAGTGVISSPVFRIEAETIRLAVCGHDGPGGGQKKNFVALVDARKGHVLRQTFAPGSDAMQEVLWQVGDLRGREVRVEVHDGHAGSAFAWIGVGRIEAGSLSVDFRRGMPPAWMAQSDPAAKPLQEVLAGPIPFRRYQGQYSLIPAAGKVELPCGFAAQYLFFLGGTVAEGKPLEQYGQIELLYRDGTREVFPLMYGFTLDRGGKMLSRSKALHLRPTADPFQHYLVIAPQAQPIEKIVLRRDPGKDVTPRITAVTCQTAAESPNLVPLSSGPCPAEEAAWIASHALRPGQPDLTAIVAEIRRVHKLPAE